MSHKSKEHGQVNIEQFQRDQIDESIGFSQSESVDDSVKGSLQNNIKVLLGIGIAGIAAGATLYLLRTERGRNLSSQISTSVSDSMGKVQDSVNEAMSKAKNSVMQLANRWRVNSAETDKLNPATSGDRFRRVV